MLAITADDIFESYSAGIDTPTAWLGIICYTLQIYFDNPLEKIWYSPVKCGVKQRLLCDKQDAVPYAPNYKII